MFLLRETDYKKVKILFWVTIVDLCTKYSNHLYFTESIIFSLVSLLLNNNFK